MGINVRNWLGGWKLDVYVEGLITESIPFHFPTSARDLFLQVITDAIVKTQEQRTAVTDQKLDPKDIVDRRCRTFGRAGAGHLIDGNDNGRSSVGCDLSNAGHPFELLTKVSAQALSAFSDSRTASALRVLI